MRHGVKLNRLGRTSEHRKALMKNMTISLIEHKRITTTLAKAKALRVYVEPMLTKSKVDSTHNRRLVFAKLQNKEALKELFSTINSAIGDRPGGYTRIIKLAPRLGDAAEMAMIELVDFNTLYTGKVVEEKKKTRRSKASAGAEGTAAPKAKAPKAKATPTEETAAEATETKVEEINIVTETAPVAEVETTTVAETVAVVEDAPGGEEVPVVAETVAVVENATAVEEVPVVAETVAVVEDATAVEVNATTSDDLSIVEGIGPKIAALFVSKGITTFAQLAATSVEDMKSILEAEGPSYASKDPGTWAQQAQMAADGKFDELEAWKKELNNGK